MLKTLTIHLHIVYFKSAVHTNFACCIFYLHMINIRVANIYMKLSEVLLSLYTEEKKFSNYL